jgi:hypothetical protein
MTCFIGWPGVGWQAVDHECFNFCVLCNYKLIQGCDKVSQAARGLLLRRATVIITGCRIDRLQTRSQI